MIRMNGEGWRRTGLWTKRNARLSRQMLGEALHSEIEGRIMRSDDGDRERSRDRQLPASRLHAGRHGHEVELRLSLGKRQGGKDEKDTCDHERTHISPEVKAVSNHTKTFQFEPAQHFGGGEGSR